MNINDVCKNNFVMFPIITWEKKKIFENNSYFGFVWSHIMSLKVCYKQFKKASVPRDKQ